MGGLLVRTFSGCQGCDIGSSVQRAMVAPRLMQRKRKRAVVEGCNISESLAPAQKTTSTNNFDVVIFRSAMARLLYRSMISGFQPPDVGQSLWKDLKSSMEGQGAMNDRVCLPVLAMKE